MYLVAMAWIYVALMMAVVEATASNGTVLGALVTFLFYGLLPLGLVTYIYFSPARRRARRSREAAGSASAAADAASAAAASRHDPDQRGHAAGHAVAPKREEP